MKIALITPLLKPVPPPKYGGIERIVETLALGLSANNHEVTLYASGQSKLNGRNIRMIECSPYPTADRMAENRKWEMHQIQELINNQNNYDIIHFHYEPFIWNTVTDGKESNLLASIRKPTVITFHNTTYIPERIKYYSSHPELNCFHYVFISRSQKRPLSFFPHSQVIYNGIVVEDFEFNANSGDYMLFLGRISRIKGIEDAICASQITGKKLVIAATIDGSDRQYFENTVKPQIDGKGITYVGELPFAEKISYLKNARCLLFPVKWEEPFGLVMIEAMATGTPVLAYNRGSVPEIVNNGENGFIVNKTGNTEGLIESINKLYLLPELIYKKMRLSSRKSVEKKFTANIMVNEYIDLYEKLIDSHI